MGYACVTTGCLGFSIPSIFTGDSGLAPQKSEQTVVEINLILLFY